MTPKFLFTIGAIFFIGATLLFGVHCAYSKLDEAQSLETRMAKNVEEFPDVDHISTDTLATLLDAGTVLLIDTREPEEFAVSHLPGAINLTTAEQVKKAVDSAEQTPAVVALYCSVGYRSAVLAEKATKAGVMNVKNVNGSIFQWAIEDRPLVGEGGENVTKVHPYDEFWGRLLPEEKRAAVR